MRKALCVGIDSYQNIADLHGCVNDANSVKSALERNGDGTLNFNVKVMCATSDDSYITKSKNCLKARQKFLYFIILDTDLLIILVAIYVQAKSIALMMASH